MTCVEKCECQKTLIDATTSKTLWFDFCSHVSKIVSLKNECQREIGKDEQGTNGFTPHAKNVSAKKC